VVTWILLVSELIFVGILLFGVAMIYPPAALILAGIFGVWACERASATRVAKAMATRRTSPIAVRRRES
jgi:hypothetical protein